MTTLTPFIKTELTEARMFFGPDNVKGKSAEQIADIIYLIFMMIEVVRFYKPELAANYANQTLSYNTYENTHYAGTDLGNLLAILNNQDTFKAYIKVDGKIAIPLFQINRYLQSIRSQNKSNSEDATFFWRLEDYLRLYSKSLFRQLRRDVGRWSDLTYSDKVALTQILRREFDKRAGNVDLYLWFKQSFKIKESVNEVAKVTLVHDPDDYGAWVNDSIRDVEPIVMLPTNKIMLHEPADKTAKGLAAPENEKNVEKLVHSLRRKEKVPPILVRRVHGKYQVVDGHHRLEAYKRLHIPTIPARVVAKCNVTIEEEIDTKLDYHKSLNPALWDSNDELHEDVKDALAKIANKFSEFVDIKQIKIVDYIITGSNCAFNYTSQSDIDLHVLVDATNLGQNPLVEPFLKAKKSLWNSGHDITVKGYNVELYAEDVNDDENQLVATGVYSLLHDKWIKKPTYEPIQYNDAAVQAKAEGIMQQIDMLVNGSSNADADEIANLWDHIRRMRKAGLEKGGEFSVENLAFKAVRNNNYFDKLRNYEKHKEDEDLTLEFVEEDFDQYGLHYLGDPGEEAIAAGVTPVTDIDKLAKIIEDNCGQMLQAYRASNKVLYRGMHSRQPVVITNIRPDRKPVEMDPQVHDALNTAFRKVGLKATRSNAIFCTSHTSIAIDWGHDVYIIFVKDGWVGTTFSAVVNDYSFYRLSNAGRQFLRDNDMDKLVRAVNDLGPQVISSPSDLAGILNEEVADILITGTSYIAVKMFSPTAKMLFPKLGIQQV